MISFINTVNDILWSYIIIAMLVGCALYFTIRLGAIQFLHIGTMVRMLFKPEDSDSKANTISPFQAFAVALSSRVGTGNLAGVASAIFIGGPGAVFWMWVMALLGSATAFVEATLAQLYKRRGEDAFYGGPAYYMQHGLHRRWMGVLFAVLIMVTFGLANQSVQSTTICDALSDFLSVDKLMVGFVLTLMVMAVVFGGVQRVSRFAAVIVPFMALGYILLSLYVVVTHASELPAMLMLIIDNAFGLNQVGGGMMGIAVMQGVKRGLFSNEAGEGSAPNAAAIATTSHPVKQGYLQALGVFSDTLIICTCTASIILLSGCYTGTKDGILLTADALETTVGPGGRYFLVAAIFLFAYSTIIANCFYGETNIRFIFKDKPWTVNAFRLASCGMVLFGSSVDLQTSFTLVDLVMGLMTITNLIAIFLLFPKVKTLLQDFRRQQKEGKNPTFHRSQMPEISSDLDAWE